MGKLGHKKSKAEDSSRLINSIRSGLYQGVKTLGLSAVGTAALVGAHHLGRKQYNGNARLMDYVDGLSQTLLSPNKASNLNKAFNPNKTSSSCDRKADEAVATEVNWVSGVADLTSNEFAVVGIDRQRQICWQAPMPERVHDILIQSNCAPSGAKFNQKFNPNSKPKSNTHVAVMGRRPSEGFWVLDAHSGELLYSIKAETNRHFYGHACYSLEGDLLYVTENNTLDFSGVIGIYEVASGYKKIGEFASQGIGPHEIVMHPDGQTLVIANGGIKTERASREELNIDSMQPSLVYVDRHEGKLIQQVYPEHNQMSVRHLAMHDDGTVIIGIQFQGERHLKVPMILTHRLGQTEFTALQMDEASSNGWHRFHHYIASVAVDSEYNLVCATSPIGGCAAIFDLNTGHLIEVIELADCAGVALYPSPTTVSQSNNQSNNQLNNQLAKQSNKHRTSFLVSDGQGILTQIEVSKLSGSFSVKVEKVQQSYAFDNHLNVVKA